MDRSLRLSQFAQLYQQWRSGESSRKSWARNLGSAHVSCAGFGVTPKQSFFVHCLLNKERVMKSSGPRGRVRQDARRVRYAEIVRDCKYVLHKTPASLKLK